MYGSFIPQNTKKESPDQYAETSQPWDQLPNETDSAFSAFEAYKRIGFSRTFEKVAVRMYGEHASKHLHQIEEWADLYNWGARAKSYDAYIRQHENEIIDKQVRHSKMVIAERLGEITDAGIDIALGKKKANKDQVKMIEGMQDRAGLSKQKAAENTTNILNQIEVTAPSLPDEVQGQYDAEDADFEEIEEEAANLIPDDLKQKRFLGDE